MRIPRGASVFDLDGPIEPIAMVAADPSNVEGWKAWQVGSVAAKHVKPLCELDREGRPHLVPPG